MSATTPPTCPVIDAKTFGFPADDAHRLIETRHAHPHGVLGPHAARLGGKTGTVIRAFHPDARSVQALLKSGRTIELQRVEVEGCFAGFAEGVDPQEAYRLRFQFGDGRSHEQDDPYRFLPTFGDLDLHLFNEGTHLRLWEALGARARRVGDVDGVAFSVWAPNAARVSVVGEFCGWDGRLFPMRQVGSSGVFEIFIPGAHAGQLYKFEIKTRDGAIRLKADPMAYAAEHPPATASRVFTSRYTWGDSEWMRQRPSHDAGRSPMAIYEVHLGSWRRIPEQGNRPLTYREIAQPLVEHVKRFGFTHIELMPIAEHPFGGSWGYQVTGYYAPTSRFGTPDDFRYFVDYCHQQGVAVLLDWVPAHFPKDDFALRRFDGTALYEHEDWRRGEHPDWGTLIFNYGRNEVRAFLISNALYWLEEFHIDGLRVDAVASMLYLDYSRKEGEWMPNPYGGKEHIEAIEFFRMLNRTVRDRYPGRVIIAEESTGWSGVTRSADEEGGLGFHFKWNMGWMHDTLKYFAYDPVHRRYHQNELTFAMIYEHSERFINPLSHDEVVHGKRSLLEKMPGSHWQKFANLRLLLTYQYFRPGKKLLFMGTELAPHSEWYYDASLDWHLADDPMRAGLARLMEDVGRWYLNSPCLWRREADHDDFAWIDCNDHDHSILSFMRRNGDDLLVIILNLTPVPREGYRIGAPIAGRYQLCLSTDDTRYAGSGYPCAGEVRSEPIPYHAQPQSMLLTLPPLAAVVLKPA